MLCDDMQSFIMLSISTLCAVMLNVIMLSVIMLFYSHCRYVVRRYALTLIILSGISFCVI